MTQVEMFAATRREDFKALVERYWRVRFIPSTTPTRCEGKTRKGACTFRARYKYSGVKPCDMFDVGTSGAFCWHHLVHVGIYGNPGDGYAFEKWAAKR